ncbi:branched-chain amino acid ABC transporter substrate-binding protein [Dermacoccus abyssi]|uniref:branched-chain amino acid ABC transporter substrate-binding protein n=1 Tax=Dermacoccus abyssi TaxID=322596 RepID=UPI0021A86369|nr:branched-chain amino acid ABC transporter substrate-binding protein [Dermacoccus abyssi]
MNAKLTYRVAGLGAAAALALTGCANDSSKTSNSSESGGASGVNLPAVQTVDTPKSPVMPKGDGKAKCSNVTIGYVGAVTGDNAQLGVNIYNGIQTAINEHNQANKDCQVKFEKLDTEGSPDKAPGPVTTMANKSQVVGVVGLPFSGESNATGNIFESKGLVHITPAATLPELTTKGWKTFFRGLGNDSVQGPAAAKLMTEKLKAEKVFVVQDDSPYGVGLGGETTKALGDKQVGSDKVTTKQKDFSATVTKIMNAKPDAVFYAGYYAEASPFAQQLRAKGFKGSFVGPDGVKDNEFIKQAGLASDGAYFTCPCIPGELIKDFNDAYKKTANNAAPGTYSIEGYDAATVLLAGIDAGKTDRKSLLEWVKTYDKDGLSKHYKWDDKGELAKPDVYGYKVEGGKILPIGKI